MVYTMSEGNKIALKKIIIARYYGFCMGVRRAIKIAEESHNVDQHVTILNEIVHNDAVVDKFRRAGIAQSKAIDEIDCGTVIISAHGVSPDIYEKAESKGLNIIDATCPLVLRIHKIIDKLAEDGYIILHFGDPDHDETIGIVGSAPDRVKVIRRLGDIAGLDVPDDKVALTAQTTARISDFKKIEKAVRKKFESVKVYNTICDATGQRQNAVEKLAPQVDMMLVVGSETSANSKRLAQISESICKQSYLINTADDIDPNWFHSGGEKIETVGLTAGASTPGFLIEGAISRLKKMTTDKVEVIYPPQTEMNNRLALKESPLDDDLEPIEE
jgi:4-hydroxy-3-methylbut-2-enyl diphosphate reductase